MEKNVTLYTFAFNSESKHSCSTMTGHLSVDVVLLLAAFSSNLSLRGELKGSECIVSGKENQKATHHVQSLALLPSTRSNKTLVYVLT